MSLNGLDEAKVAEAHQAALAEAGGWFLLHYTTRDTVELLSRGSGGVAEVRSAITKYEEKSPLFGLVQFRRKKIILKYVPEGTSRLLQVRLTVQFQSVLETFVPHDTVLSFATPTELTESALTSACMLHPSPMSLTSSASSLRRQRLGEISEDAEESPHIRGQSKSKVVATPAPPSTKLTDHDRKEPSPVVAVEPLVEKAHPVLLREQPEVAPPAANKEAAAAQDSSISTPRGSSATPTPRAAPAAEKALPSTPQPTPPSTSGGQTSTPPVPDDAPELPPIQHLSNSYRVEESESRVSLQSARPSVHEGRPSFPTLYDSYDPNKPKVKRGPRPHVASESRPQTAGSKGGQSQRLVANLPTSVRAQPRLTANTDRPGSQQSSRSVPSKFVHYSQPPPLPLLPSPHHISSLFLPESQPERAYSRAGSITSTATAAATPEKLRLMKALQMRKRNQQMAKHESETSEQPETSKTSVQSQVAADLEPVRSHPATRSSGAESTSASRIAEATKATEAARMTSPTSMTTVSEVPSTQSSSFVEDNDTTSHASISSDTSSSVTPKADIREAQQRKQAESPMPVPAKELDEQEAPALLASRSLHDAPLTREIENTARPSTAESIISSDLDEDVPQYHESAPEHEQSILAAPADPPQVGGNITDAVPLNHESSEAEQEARPPVPSKSDDDDDDQARRRKRADLEPIKLLSSPELSDASDDDSFMEELQNAKVQHAKPIAVGRSPATPIYRTLSGSVDRLKDVSRTVSGPLHNSANSASTSPEHSRPRSVRSISTALPSWPPSNENIPPVPLAKKGPLSSGISKRIKALEVFTSGREPSASPPPVTQLNTLAQKSKAALSSSRKRLSFIQGGNASNTSIATPAPALFSSLTQTPEMESTEYDRSTALFQNHSTITETYKPQQKGETISVTARIVRHPDTINEDSTSATNDSQSIPLQRSKLTFDHEQPAPSDRPALAREPSTFSNDTPGKFSQNERARPSFSSYRSESQTRLPTSESMASRLSVVSGKRRDRSNLPRSSSDNSSVTTEKSRQSRTRRLMMRVSNLSTNSRRNIVGVFSPNPKDQTAAQSITERAESDHDLASIAESVSHVVDIGDVNVQFSDTLLWKRRFLRIDDQGYLIFTPPTMERNVRNISRKFHLTEFKKPTLPDVEREEMAWSILLDSEDGSCIQCACESKYSQTQVLRMLVDAHNAYHQLYSA